MQINNCLVIIKQTALAQGGRAASFARKGDETAKRLLHADAEQKRTVDAVRRALINSLEEENRYAMLPGRRQTIWQLTWRQ